jgi:hypothetical protein
MYAVKYQKQFNDFYHMQGLSGATVARLTPDQKAACSNHVRFIYFCLFGLLHLNLTALKMN